MPCVDDYQTREQQLDVKAPALLGVLMRSLSPVALEGALGRADWKAVGLTRADFNEWVVMDQRRELAGEAERELVRRKALDKLTIVERKALGLE